MKRIVVSPGWAGGLYEVALRPLRPKKLPDLFPAQGVVAHYELPISIPVTNTSAPPSPTCNAADGIGVSM